MNESELKTLTDLVFQVQKEVLENKLVLEDLRSVVPVLVRKVLELEKELVSLREEISRSTE